MKVEYRLSALDDFACLGSDCPDSCCDVGWDIHLEPDIHRRWAEVGNETERARLLGSVREVERNGKKVLLMSADENRRCLLLTPEGLCSAQARHGASFLPGICRDYPRAQDDGLAHHVATAVLSCPEIARRVLFPSADGVVFRKTVLDHAVGLLENSFVQYSLTELLDRVMAEPRFPTAARIYYLADFLVRMAHLSSQGQLSASLLGEAPGKCRNELYAINVRIKERRLRPEPALAGAFWHAMIQLGKKLQILPALPEPLSHLDRTELPADATADYIALYAGISRCRLAAQPLLRGIYERPLTRYLYASLLNGGFAWQPKANNYIATFMNALIPYALVNLQLWLAGAAAGSLSENTLIETVYRTERALHHNTRLYTTLDTNPALLRIDHYHSCFVDL